MTKRKMLHIEENVAESFRELAVATNKDQSDLLRDLMSQEISYSQTVTINQKMANRIEEPIGDFNHEAQKLSKKGDEK
ncbi:MAG: hypothetical protein ABSC20_06315 [Candidatus Bathyarchaeia archaeon]|jgi:hypothetical protein